MNIGEEEQGVNILESNVGESIEKDIEILENFPDDFGTYQGDLGGDMEKRYDEIVKIMEGYLGKKYASERR